MVPDEALPAEWSCGPPLLAPYSCLSALTERSTSRQKRATDQTPDLRQEAGFGVAVLLCHRRWVLTDDRLREIADQLVAVPGVVGVMLGGSRARGEHSPDSDVDLGLYYRRPLDIPALRGLAQAVTGAGTELTELGAWGNWVDGGGWLTIEGMAVDWLYRDLDRVHESWRQAQAGQLDFHFQVGHPLGIPGFAYAGEVALGVVLADPQGELAALKQRTAAYPPLLVEALVGRLEEARFVLGAVRKTADRGDVTYLAGCLFRVLGLSAYALHAAARRWVVNEKGVIDSAGRLSIAPPDFSRRAHGVLARLGYEPEQLRASLTAAEKLVDEVAACCQPDHNARPPRSPLALRTTDGR